MPYVCVCVCAVCVCVCVCVKHNNTSFVCTSMVPVISSVCTLVDEHLHD